MSVVHLDPSHDGRRVVVHVGDSLHLVLPEPATSGYRWHLDDPAAGLTIERNELAPPTAAGGADVTGAAGVRHVVARVTGPGPLRLSLRLLRRWDPQEASAQRYVVDIETT